MEYFLLLVCITIVQSSCLKGNVPPTPEHGKLVFDSDLDPVNEGSKARLCCRGGYRYDNSLALTCSGGNWEGHLGECIAQGCQKAILEELLGGSPVQFSYEPGMSGAQADHLTKATVGCEDGYELKSMVKNGKLTCQLNNCTEGFEDLNSDHTFLCHFGTWVGRKSQSQCVTIQEKTDLEIACASLSRSFYSRSSCFVGSANKKTYNAAKTSCNHFTLGHLAFVTTSDTLTRFHQLQPNFLPERHFTGLYQVDTASEPYGGWAWVWNSTLHWLLPSWEMAQWESGQPDDNVGHSARAPTGVLGLTPDFIDGHVLYSRPYLCQYHEPTQSVYQLVGSSTRGHPATLLSAIESVSLFSCAQECHKVPVCDSFSFNKSNRTCHLQWLDGITLATKYGPIHDQDFDMYRVD